MLPRLAILGLTATLLIGCGTINGPGDSASGPAGACGGDILNYQKGAKRQADRGRISRSVYNQILSELDRAAATCLAGRDSDARRQLAATQGRYGTF